jgi:hypothetical protein
MQISDQHDECSEGHGEQQAHHTPQPAQKRIPTVAAIGPILTRVAMNFAPADRLACRPWEPA